MHKQYDSFDLAKLICSIFVIMIHSSMDIQICVTRIAVPLFFIISSFLFFSGLNGTSDDRVHLAAFLKRNMCLYLFWTVFYAPFGILIKQFLFSDQFLFADGIQGMIITFFLGYVYLGSWFLPALMICIAGVFITRRLPIWLQILGGAITYAMCLLHTNYAGLIPMNTFIWKVILKYPTSFSNSFPAGILWVVIGRILAQRSVELSQISLRKSGLFFLRGVRSAPLRKSTDTLDWRNLGNRLLCDAYSFGNQLLCFLI